MYRAILLENTFTGLMNLNVDKENWHNLQQKVLCLVREGVAVWLVNQPKL